MTDAYGAASEWANAPDSPANLHPHDELGVHDLEAAFLAGVAWAVARPEPERYCPCPCSNCSGSLGAEHQAPDFIHAGTVLSSDPAHCTNTMCPCWAAPAPGLASIMRKYGPLHPVMAGR